MRKKKKKKKAFAQDARQPSIKVLAAGFEPAKLAHGVLNPTPLTNSDTLVPPKKDEVLREQSFS